MVSLRRFEIVRLIIETLVKKSIKKKLVVPSNGGIIAKIKNNAGISPRELDA